MNALSPDLWSEIALSLASCHELRSTVDAVKDLCSVRSVNTKSRNSCSQAFAALAAVSRKPDVPDGTGESLSAQAILHHELQLCKNDKLSMKDATSVYCLSLQALLCLQCTASGYYKEEVLCCAREHYPGAESLQQIHCIAAAAQALQEKEKSNRQQTMQSHLSDRGLNLRDDSRLCSAYIQWGTGNPAQIADTMLEMDWLFQHTSYSGLVQDRITELTEELEGYEDLDPFTTDRAVWDYSQQLMIDLDNASTFAKKKAMTYWEKRHPRTQFTGPQGLLKYMGIPETVEDKANGNVG